MHYSTDATVQIFHPCSYMLQNRESLKFISGSLMSWENGDPCSPCILIWLWGPGSLQQHAALNIIMHASYSVCECASSGFAWCAIYAVIIPVLGQMCMGVIYITQIPVNYIGKPEMTCWWKHGCLMCSFDSSWSWVKINIPLPCKYLIEHGSLRSF